MPAVDADVLGQLLLSEGSNITVGAAADVPLTPIAVQWHSPRCGGLVEARGAREGCARGRHYTTLAAVADMPLTPIAVAPRCGAGAEDADLIAMLGAVADMLLAPIAVQMQTAAAKSQVEKGWGRHDA